MFRTPDAEQPTSGSEGITLRRGSTILIHGQEEVQPKRKPWQHEAMPETDNTPMMEYARTLGAQWATDQHQCDVEENQLSDLVETILLQSKNGMVEVFLEESMNRANATAEVQSISMIRRMVHDISKNASAEEDLRDFMRSRAESKTANSEHI